MTRLGATALTERLGVAHVERVCAHARMSFRALPVQDVGIDGFIEVLDDNVATGVFIGVQIKAGTSFIGNGGVRFTFKSDQNHYAYWARCPFLMLAIVVDPNAERAAWFNLSEESTDERIVQGPYSLSADICAENEFSPEALQHRIAPIAPDFLYRRRTLEDTKGLLQSPEPHETPLAVPSLEVNPDREAEWLHLISVFRDADSDWQDVADAGYRLSWYYPGVTPAQQDKLSSTLATLTDSELANVISAISELILEDATTRAELVIDLLAYVPNVGSRIEAMLGATRIPPRCLLGAIQGIEYLAEGPRPDLWDRFGGAITGGGS